MIKTPLQQLHELAPLPWRWNPGGFFEDANGDEVAVAMGRGTHLPIIDINLHVRKALINALVIRNDSALELLDALDSIRQYGEDTLSGPVGDPDDRKWHRDGVIEMTRRARAAIAAAKGEK